MNLSISKIIQNGKKIIQSEKCPCKGCKDLYKKAGHNDEKEIVSAVKMWEGLLKNENLTKEEIHAEAVEKVASRLA